MRRKMLDEFDKKDIEEQKPLAIKTDRTNPHERFARTVEHLHARIGREIRTYVAEQVPSWKKVYDMGQKIAWIPTWDLISNFNLQIVRQQGLWLSSMSFGRRHPAIDTNSGEMRLYNSHETRIEAITDNQIYTIYAALGENNEKKHTENISFLLDRFINADATLDYLTLIYDRGDPEDRW